MTLEQLQTEDWSDITSGTYGPPDEVLASLQQLAFHTEDVSFTTDEFCCEIYHQGDVYETTVRAIPYLIELIRSPAKPHQRLHADLLVGLAFFYTGCGVDYYRPHALGETRSVPDITLQVETAVRQGLDTYLTCCSDSRQEVQLAALVLLGCLQEDAEYILPYVKARIKMETAPVQRAALFFCYGRLASSEERETVLYAHFADTEELPAVRMMLALTLGETEENLLSTVLSSRFYTTQHAIQEAVHEYLKPIIAQYGESDYDPWEEWFSQIVYSVDSLDVALETILGTIEED